MTQDTRKDPRAKVLTMTVRYKSATVDEFIEQYSLDISRGGIFIKTSSPFAPGTLLKFEIRIAEDRTVLQGVGRVVWKRDPVDAGNARPAGMGVKFIKLDDASKQVIEDLVSRYEESGSAYEAGLVASSATATAAGESPSEADGAAPLRKATMIGLGGLDAAAVIAAAQAEATEGAPAGEKAEEGSSSFFPETDSEAEMPPPGERTVMRQAAELLQEALLGAGGTMDEIGAIGAEPLVDETGQGTAIELTKSPSPSAYPPPRSSASSQSLQAVPAEIPSMGESPSEPSEAPEEVAAIGAEDSEATPEPEMVASEKPAAISPPPPQVAQAAKSASTPASSGGNRGLIYLGVIAAAAAGIYFMFGGSSAPEPPVTTVNAPPTETTEPAKETPAPVEEAKEGEDIVKEEEPKQEEPAVASDEKPTEPSAAASVTAPSVEPEPPTKPAAVTVEKKSAPAPKPAKEAPVEVAAEKPAPAPKPVVKKPAETEAKPAAEKPAATEAKPAAEKAPAPKPKPAPVDDDNPY